MNKQILSGRLGNDPEIRTLDNGTKKSQFSLATTDRYKDLNGNKVEETDWHNCVAFGNLSEVIEKYLRKGSEVTIFGKHKTRKYKKKDGSTGYVSETVIKEIDFHGSKQSENVNEPELSNDEDSLPF